MRTLPQFINQPVFVRSLEEYQTHASQSGNYAQMRQRFELHLVQEKDEFSIPGFCWPCQQSVGFEVDFKYSKPDENQRIPNWRERLICPRCHLNNRLRAIVHLLERVIDPPSDSTIYATEQVTDFFRFLSTRYPNLIGSEFLGSEVPFGACTATGVRNESVTALTFDTSEIDCLLSFEVLEHVPDYHAAIQEFARVLRPGGSLLLTIPFDCNRYEHLTRATVEFDGTIIHHLPAEYHGDPINSEGCLCYKTFGWQLIDQLHEAGFSEAVAALYWSPEFGYLGGEQLSFIARK